MLTAILHGILPFIFALANENKILFRVFQVSHDGLAAYCLLIVEDTVKCPCKFLGKQRCLELLQISIGLWNRKCKRDLWQWGSWPKPHFIPTITSHSLQPISIDHGFFRNASCFWSKLYIPERNY
jgi:hypothetical protein